MTDREVCLFITLNCNQNCEYCHRFLGIDEVNKDCTKEIIDKVVADGIENITFTGGEPLIYSNIIEILKYAKEKGVKNKLITNGEMLALHKEMREIYNYLDSITLSIDSVDSNINEQLGRGTKHFENIKSVLDSLKTKKIKININTVITKININDIEKLGKFLNNYNINAWRVFKFIPLREKAKVNEKKFDISTADFRIHRPMFASFENIQKVEFREDEDYEDKYVLIMPNGNIVLTENKEDITIGNIFENSIIELINNREYNKTQKIVNKIRTLIAYNDENIKSNIVNAMKKLNYVEIVGVATNGTEALNEIINLQPEMVFTRYNLNDMSAVEMVEKVKDKLNEKQIPVFNFITDNIPINGYIKLNKLLENKINAYIPEENKEKRIVDILKDYKDLIN